MPIFFRSFLELNDYLLIKHRYIVIFFRKFMFNHMKFKSYIEEIKNISHKYTNTLPEFEDELNIVQEEINGFSAYIPVIGMFSAGKSSLLNSWLGNDLLPEDQDATTAIATELHFGQKTAMRIFFDDGESKEILQLPKDAEQANADEVSNGAYAICTVNSTRLEQLNGITPIDMPGTDSDIQRHTEALYRYAHKGSGYLLVLDTGSGTIPASLMAFLCELNLMDKPLMIALHKCDKYTEEQLTEVESHILMQCGELKHVSPHLIRTSSWENETPELLQELFTGLDVERLCIQKFKPRVYQFGERLITHIQDLRDNSELDTAQITKKMQSLIEASLDIENMMKREERELSQKLRTHTVNNVINDIGGELYQNLETLCEILGTGDQNTFTNKVTGIVNRVCEESLQRNISANVDLFISKIEESVTISSEELANTLRVSAEGMSGAMSGILKVVKEGGKTYKVVATVLAVTTGVVMPIIEVLIIFLPDIIQFFSNPEEKRKQLIRDKLTGEIFPKIKSQVNAELQKQMPDIEQEILQQLRSGWKERVDDSKSALDSCRNEKENEEIDWKERQENYNNDIKAINNLLTSMKD